MLSVLSPRANLAAFDEIFGLLRRHRALTVEMTKRDIGERYAGQVLGSVWAIGHPLALMAIYVFVFAFVFKIEITGPLDYTAYMLSGLVPWMAFQEVMARASTVVTGNANLVKQVVFPIEVLPVKGVIVALVTQLISTALLVLYVLAAHQTVLWTYVLLPYLLVLQMLAMTGTAMILAAVGVYFRDLKDIVQVFCTANLFLMPLFYQLDNQEGIFKLVLYGNPFVHMVLCHRDATYHGEIANPWSWAVLTILSVVLFCVGYRVFRQLKTMFGNVL